MGNIGGSREEDRKVLEEKFINHYRHVHYHQNGHNEPRWRGTRVVKYPQDLILYAQVIFKRKPDFIIETGTHFGGSALFLGDMLQLVGGKKVFSIDVSHKFNPPKHPMVEHILGSSTDPDILERLKKETAGARVMASLDSDHRSFYVTKELEAYASIVTPGQYMVVEDCWTRHPTPFWPYASVEAFLKTHRNYQRFPLEKQFIYAVTRDGWLRRLR